jgi:hypothetical protein
VLDSDAAYLTASAASASEAMPAVRARVMSETPSMRSLAHAMVGGLVVTTLLWSARIGLSIGGWQRPVAAVCGLLALSVLYRRRSRTILHMIEGTALWIAFTAAGCVLTYLCATWARPLQDATLTAIDHALGFDWLAWRDIVFARPALHWALFLAYGCLLPQMVVSILFFPAIGLSRRGIELLRLAALTLLPTVLISGLYPALGPFASFGGEETAYLPHLLALRAGGPWAFNLISMQGIVTMPSYHAMLAVLFTYAYRGTGPIGWVIAGLNGVMLLSIPPIGGHYLVDMIAGGAIALLCVLGSRLRRFRGGTVRLGSRPVEQPTIAPWFLPGGSCQHHRHDAGRAGAARFRGSSLADDHGDTTPLSRPMGIAAPST